MSEENKGNNILDLIAGRLDASSKKSNERIDQAAQNNEETKKRVEELKALLYPTIGAVGGAGIGAGTSALIDASKDAPLNVRQALAMSLLGGAAGGAGGLALAAVDKNPNQKIASTGKINMSNMNIMQKAAFLDGYQAQLMQKKAAYAEVEKAIRDLVANRAKMPAADFQAAMDKIERKSGADFQRAIAAVNKATGPRTVSGLNAFSRKGPSQKPLTAPATPATPAPIKATQATVANLAPAAAAPKPAQAPTFKAPSALPASQLTIAGGIPVNSGTPIPAPAPAPAAGSTSAPAAAGNNSGSFAPRTGYQKARAVLRQNRGKLGGIGGLLAGIGGTYVAARPGDPKTEAASATKNNLSDMLTSTGGSSTAAGLGVAGLGALAGLSPATAALLGLGTGALAYGAQGGFNEPKDKKAKA
jgi:hypothetical protein